MVRFGTDIQTLQGPKTVIMKVLILAFAALFVINVECTDTCENKGRTVCYYNADSQDRPKPGKFVAKNIPFDLCTHVLYSFIGLTDDTNEVKKSERGENGDYLEFTSYKDLYPDVKFMVVIGGWDEGGAKYSKMVSTPESRANFTNSIIDFMNTYNFDGLDLDWEYPGATERDGTAADKQNFAKLAEELTEAFEEYGFLLTAAVPLTKSRIDAGYDVPRLAAVLDAIHIMSYDLRGNWDGFADNHAVFQQRPTDTDAYKKVNVVDGLKLWEDEGCPANKLVVGIPFYGRSYVLKSASEHDIGAPIDQAAGGADPAPYTNARGLWSYYEICSKLKNETGWTRAWDKAGKGPYAYNGNQWVGYDDPQSVKEKVNFIKKKGYLGAMTWSIDMDDFNGMCGKRNPLISIMHKGMKNYVVPEPKPKPYTNPVSRV